MSDLMVVITGMAGFPMVNIRSGPGVGNAQVYQAPVGTRDVVALEVQPDDASKEKEGKLHQWLKLRFPNGQEGWGRDDLIQLQPGDWSAFGYGQITTPTVAFDLTRSAAPAEPAKTKVPVTRVAVPVIEPEPTPAPTPTSEPTPEPAATPAPATTPAAAPVSGCVAMPSQDSNMRSGPATKYAPPVARVPAGSELPVSDVVPEEGGGAFRWVKVTYNGQEGYIREDLMTYAGNDCGKFNLKVSAADLFGAPMDSYAFVRGFTGPQPNHPGWDLGAGEGTPMFSGPVEGYVWRSHTCTKCTPGKPSVKDHGIQIGDSSLFTDAGWGWGNGHHVIVRYMNKDLPASTQQDLAAQGCAGWHLYVTYAHMHSLAVQQGRTISPKTQIGTCGNTGNSAGSHLHLEVRAFAQVTGGPTGYSRMKLLAPEILFKR